jgi:hypothetical protein
MLSNREGGRATRTTRPEKTVDTAANTIRAGKMPTGQIEEHVGGSPYIKATAGGVSQRPYLPRLRRQAATVPLAFVGRGHITRRARSEKSGLVFVASAKLCPRPADSWGGDERGSGDSGLVE